MGRSRSMTNPRHALWDCQEGDYAYYAYTRDEWHVIKVLEDGSARGNTSRCEIVAASERSRSIVGHIKNLQREIRVKKLCDMEVIALMAL